jgi:poly(hydroxyalkanoate) granule-associated protein
MIPTTIKETPTKVKESTDKAINKVGETTQPVVNPIVRAARALLLASIGTIALSKEEIESLVNRLVEKGEITEKDGRKLVAELTTRTKEISKAPVEKVKAPVGKATTHVTTHVSTVSSKTEDILTKRIESVLNAMNIPSKQDIDQLTRKIDTLSRKVSALDKKLAAPETKKPATKKAATKKAA